MKAQTFILIPGWLERAMQGANKNLVDILDGKTLSSILSNNDLIFYGRYQDRVLSKIAPELMASSVPTWQAEFFGADYEKNERFMKAYRDADWIDDPTITSIIGTDLGISEAQQENPKAYTYEIYELKPDVYGVRVRAAAVDQSPLRNEKEALFNAIQKLSLVHPFTDLAGMTVFKRYIKVVQKLAHA